MASRWWRQRGWRAGRVVGPLATLLLIAGLPRDGVDAGAAPAPAAIQTTTTAVQVGLYLLSVGQVDTSLGTYTLDFYLAFRCDRPCNPGAFEFVNGRAISRTLEENTPTYQVYRVQAALAANLNLRAYPFDRHTLSVSLEDQVLTQEALVYVVDDAHTAIDPALILPGWAHDGDWSATVTEQAYSIFDERYSRYTFSLGIRRPVDASIMKGIVPAALIVLAGFFALVLGTDNIVQRLMLGTSVLISSVLYHLTFTAALPPVPYLTLADRLMVVNYAALVLILASTVALLVLESRKEVDAARRVQRLTMVGIPVLWLTAQALNVASL